MMKSRRAMTLLLATLLIVSLASFAFAAADQPTLAADDSHLYIAVGKTASTKLTIAPSAAKKAGVTYAISDESVATVDARGKVKGVAAGDCTLTVVSKYDSSLTLDIPVSVVTPVKKLSASIDQSTLHIGKTGQITCAYTPEDATVKQASYESSKESVATVDENGVVTGVSRGQAVITVRSLDGYAKAQVRVTIKQQPTSLELTPNPLTLTVGSRGAIKATVLPKDADNKSVVWSSSDESVATVDKNGRVTSVSRGEATITATSAEDPSVSASAKVEDVQLATSISFAQKQFDVIINQTAQLELNVQPADADNKAVTYKVKNAKIASVDENGVVTGLAGGKTTVTATTADGSRKRATATIEVIVPVTGVTFKQNDVRVGARSRGRFRVNIVPEKATNKNMTWVSSDESIATVTSKNDTFTVSGRQWGRCTITGTTVDGGYSCTIYVDVGSLRHAMVVRSVQIRDGKPYITLQNNSNMDITNVYYNITGVDVNGNTVPMSTRRDTLEGDYQHTLAPGERTRHGYFSFYRPSNYKGLATISIAITGWDTSTGYYDHNGDLQYSYRLNEKSYEWVSWTDPDAK